MVVAVHLVEVLALVSALGMLFGLSFVIVLSAKVLYTCLFIFAGCVNWVGSVLHDSEKTIFYSIINLCDLSGMSTADYGDGDNSEGETKSVTQ